MALTRGELVAGGCLSRGLGEPTALSYVFRSSESLGWVSQKERVDFARFNRGYKRVTWQQQEACASLR